MMMMMIVIIIRINIDNANIKVDYLILLYIGLDIKMMRMDGMYSDVFVFNDNYD